MTACEDDRRGQFRSRCLDAPGLQQRGLYWGGSRARYAVPGPEANPSKTPARIAYEINIDNGEPHDYDITGSIYLIVKAHTGVQNRLDWNTMDIQVRNNLIRVSLNGKVVAEHAGFPDRPKVGPIGLQLHDFRDVVMFRKIRVRELR